MPSTLDLFVQIFTEKVDSFESFKTDLSGRTVVVTGANIGCGLEAARQWARMNPSRIIIACRDLKKGNAAVEDIKKTTGFANIQCWELDQARFSSVVAFCDRFETEGGGHLDLLALNAGVSQWTYKTTPDGWEEQLQVNHLSTALLAIRLLPYMLNAPRSPPTPRLVIMSSGLLFFINKITELQAPNMLKKLTDEKHCKDRKVFEKRYYVTKLFNAMFAHSLAARLPSTTALSVFSLSPPLTKTGLQRNLPAPMKMMLHAMARKPEEGGRALSYVGVSSKLNDVKSGSYVQCCKVLPLGPYIDQAEGKEVERRLWDETVEVLTAVDSKVQSILERHLIQVDA